MRDHAPRRGEDVEPAARRPRQAQAAAPDTAADTKPGDAATSRFDAHSVLALQRTVGNTAVVRLLRTAGLIQPSTTTDVLRSTGRPLDAGTRDEMESRLGADFGDVRVHDDAAAAESARRLGARAYTSGSHIVVGEGGADPHTLAHELTHVIQQRRGPVSGTDNGAGLRISDPSDRFEREAEANATRALSGPPPSRRREPGPDAARGGSRPPEPGAEPVVQRVLVAGDDFSRDNILNLAIVDRLSGTPSEAAVNRVRAQLEGMLNTLRGSNRTITVRIDGTIPGRGTFRALRSDDPEQPPRGEVRMRQEPAENPTDTRYFLTALAHELQHAVDFVNRGFGLPGTDPEVNTREAYKTMGSELRAWGREAVVALQLGPGGDAERVALIDVYRALYARRGEAPAAVRAIPLDNVFLARLLAYLSSELPALGITTNEAAREWLARQLEPEHAGEHSVYVRGGLMDGAGIFGLLAAASSDEPAWDLD